MRHVFLVAALVLLAASKCFAAGSSSEQALQELIKAKDFKCMLKSGYQVKFDGSSVDGRESEFSSNPEDSTINFAQLDLIKGTALLVGNAGSSPLEVFVGETGLTFLEKTDNGNIVVYKIFANKYDRKYFFVNSRHPQISAAITISLPSQYYGSCKITN